MTKTQKIGLMDEMVRACRSFIEAKTLFRSVGTKYLYLGGETIMPDDLNDSAVAGLDPQDVKIVLAGLGKVLDDVPETVAKAVHRLGC